LDMKPANVVNINGPIWTAKLVEFGLAQLNGPAR